MLYEYHSETNQVFATEHNIPYQIVFIIFLYLADIMFQPFRQQVTNKGIYGFYVDVLAPDNVQFLIRYN